MSKEAMKLALEALENSIDLVEEDYDNAVSLYGKYPSRAKRLIGMETMRDDHRKAITTLREALAEQPAQRTWSWLTNVEIASACKKNGGSEWWWKDIEEFARAIEAKLKEKNT